MIDINPADLSSGSSEDRRGFVVEAAPVDGKFRRFIGDIEDVSKRGSVLRDKKFGTIMFNGSWVAGGNNWTVREMLEGRYANAIGSTNPDWNSPEFTAFLEPHLTEVLQQSKNHLTPNGIIILTSPRYAFHGAGFRFDKLPEEKLEFLDMIRRAVELGAKKVTILGVSSEGVQQMFQYNLDDSSMRAIRERQLLSGLFIGTWGGSKYTLSHKDGSKLSYDELVALFKDDTKRTQLIQTNPQIVKEIEEGLREHTQAGQQIIGQLTGGIEALPDQLEFAELKPDMIKKGHNCKKVRLKILL